jgi:hypothetical protein
MHLHSLSSHQKVCPMSNGEKRKVKCVKPIDAVLHILICVSGGHRYTPDLRLEKGHSRVGN